MRRKKKPQMADEEDEGKTQPSSSGSQRFADLAGVLHAAALELLGQLRIVDAGRGERLSPASDRRLTAA